MSTTDVEKGQEPEETEQQAGINEEIEYAAERFRIGIAAGSVIAIALVVGLSVRS
jgi:hypothetical protein